MEEDAVVADHFIANLERFVIGPYEDKKDQISSFSLFSYYNLVWYNTNRLVEKPYSSTKYDKDRAKTNAERRVLDMKPYQPHYKVVRKAYTSGAVAQLLPLEVAKKLSAFLQSKLPIPQDDADHYMNREFVRKMKRPRLQVEPSLVNHIGYYSERMRGQSEEVQRGRFSQMVKSIVRFRRAEVNMLHSSKSNLGVLKLSTYSMVNGGYRDSLQNQQRLFGCRAVCHWSLRSRLLTGISLL